MLLPKNEIMKYKMKLYIYTNEEKPELIAAFEGYTNEECEEKGSLYMGSEDYFATYKKLEV